MNVLGLIPARGGSKGIARKNAALLDGKPLLWYTAQAALGARSLSDVILSTDAAPLMRLGRRLGLTVPFRRPARLAQDRTPMIDVARHALIMWERQTGRRVDALALLQPTSPLRTARRIDQAVALLKKTGADTVVSVQQVPHAFSVRSQMKRLPSGWLVAAVSGPIILDRHKKQAFFARNGPAVMVVRRELLLKGTFYGGRTRGLEMEPSESIDIDTPFDLRLASFLLTSSRR